MKSSKNLLTTLVSLAVVTGVMAMPCYAATASEQQDMAKALYSINLFQGYDKTGTDFGLSDIPTREQALIFQIRALGEDSAAMAWTGNSPYVDVPANHWALPYIGYAAEKGYTSGVGNGKFGLGDSANAQTMTTFLLRGMGYSDSSGSDFTYNNSLSFGKRLGINENETSPSKFTRGDAAEIIYRALAVKTKSDVALATVLTNKGVFTQSNYDVAKKGVTSADKTGPTSVSVDKTSLNLKVGESYDLTAKVAPPGSKISLTWKSSNPEVASVGTSGIVKALKTGTTTVTVKSFNGVTATCDVTVTGGTSQNKSITVNFVNMTGKTFTELYSSASEDQDWGSSLISGSLANNGKTAVEFIFNTSAPKFDLRADCSGEYFEFKGLDMSKTANNTTYYFSMEGNDLVITATKPGATKPDPTSVFVDKTSLSLKVGGSYDITAKVAPSGSKLSLTWKSSNPDVASVGTSGIVKALKAGATTITVKSHNGLTATCNVTVTGGTSQNKSITVNFVNMTGKTFTKLYSSASEDQDWGSSLISGSLANNGKTAVEFTFNTSAPKFDLRADCSGDYYEFKGLNMSKVSNNATYYLYLDGSTPMMSATKPSTTKPEPTGISVDKTTLSLKAGESYDITAKLAPVGAKVSLTWNSSSPDVASVGTSGIVKALKAGATTITVKSYNGLTATCNVTVTGGTSQNKLITVNFVNMTGKSFTKFYSSSSEDQDWGSSLISGSLANNGKAAVEFTFNTSAPKFDLRADYSGDYYEFKGLDMSKVSNNATYYLYLDGSTPMMSTTKPSTNSVVDKTVTLYNSTDKAVTEILVSSSSITEWSQNLLTGSTLNANKTAKFIVPVSTNDTKFDIKLTYSDGTFAIFAAYDFKNFTSGSTLYAYIEKNEPYLSLEKPSVKKPEETTRVIQVTFINGTNKEFSEVCAVPTEDSSYGSNLGKLASTAKMSLDFTIPSETNSYKIRITVDGQDYLLNDITFDKNLANGSKVSIVFSADDAGNMTWSEM